LLPDISVNTAGAITAYAYNCLAIFIETNIRSVFIHHYSKDKSSIIDTQLLEIVARTMDKGSPREWYWALVDYGNYLRQSTKYTSRAAHATNLKADLMALQGNYERKYSEQCR